MRNYRIQRIYTTPDCVPAVLRVLYCQLNRNWTSLLLPFWEKRRRNNLKLSLVVVVVVARAARPPAFLSTFLNQKTEKQFFLIYVGDIFRGPDSIVISHGLFQSFSFSVSQKCYGNVSTKHHTHRCQLRRVISSFLYSAKKKKGKTKKMWRRRKQDPGWANFG